MGIDFTALVNPGVQALRPYVPGKPIEELERDLGISNSLKLASNENPLGTSPMAQAVAAQSLRELHLYPDDTAFRLRHKLAARHGVHPDQLVLGAGSSDVIDMVARAFLGPGRNAVFARHSFAMYGIYTQATGAECKVADALPADHPEQPYGHDLATLAAAVDEHTQVIFIANPNNPTGTWISKEALKAFIGALPSRLIVVLDEAYIEYVEEPGFPDGSQWLGQFPNLVVTRTFSKIYGLAALRVGYGLANPELAALISRVRHPFNVNAVALAAAEAALDDGVFVDRSIAVNREGLLQLVDGVRALGLTYIPSVANFLCVQFPQIGADIYPRLLKEGVIVRPVGGYELPQHLRISVGTSEQNCRCLEALAKVLT